VGTLNIKSKKLLYDLSRHKIAKYLLILPLVLVAVMVILQEKSFEHQKDLVLSEKRLEKKITVDLIDTMIDKSIDIGDSSDYRAVLVYAMQQVDELPMTFSALYDDNLQIATARVFDANDFDPLSDATFKRTVATHERGTYAIKYKPYDSGGEVTMHLYYRWVPTGKTPVRSRYLTVVGVSEESISTSFGGWVEAGTMIVLIFTALLQCALVWAVKTLGAMGGGYSGE
jgi:hypothetical protein